MQSTIPNNYPQPMKHTTSYFKWWASQTEMSKSEKSLFEPFFKPQEFADSLSGGIGIDTYFLNCLLSLRSNVGFPFVINSGFRSFLTNRHVGGHKNSAHLAGRAVDIRVHTTTQAGLLVSKAWEYGMHGVGVKKLSGTEVGFVHIDNVDRGLDHMMLWTYP